MNAKIEDNKSADTAAQSPPEGSLESRVKAHPFLQGMNAHQYRILSDCAMARRFPAGEVIFREGDPANRFYLIESGKLALESYVKDEGMKIIQTIGAGEALGWSWLFPPYFWHFTARVLEPTEAIFLYATPLCEECETDHELGYQLLKRIGAVMLARLQATRRQLLSPHGKWGQITLS